MSHNCRHISEAAHPKFRRHRLAYCSVSDRSGAEVYTGGEPSPGGV
jgi:hypothetical protein